MRLRKNEAHCPKEIESKKLWSIMMISNPYKTKKLMKKNMLVIREYQFSGTYDG
jgi:hypothetical protein